MNRSQKAAESLGKYGETVAATYLSNLGYQIVERNWRTSTGELDIIAYRDGILAFVEVKTRTSAAFGHPAEAVGNKKLRRIQVLAAQWLTQQPTYFPSIRFDVIAVHYAKQGSADVEHLQGVTL